VLGAGQRRAHGRPPAASRRGAPSAAAPARAPLLPATAATSSTRSNLLGAELVDDQVRADQAQGLVS
jgi:hypothetical protein